MIREITYTEERREKEKNALMKELDFTLPQGYELISGENEDYLQIKKKSWIFDREVAWMFKAVGKICIVFHKLKDYEELQDSLLRSDLDMDIIVHNGVPKDDK